jgi:branched-chain amino acid transport system substrate-binding protein
VAAKELMYFQNCAPRRSRLLPPVLLLVLLLASCTAEASPPNGDPGATAPPLHLEIAFLENLMPEGAYERVVPAFQGAKLALDQAFANGDLPTEVEIVPQDIGDPQRMSDVLSADVADPSYVGAIGSPFWSEPAAAGSRLSDAGLATVSLSSVGPANPGWNSWFRAVAPLSDQAVEVGAFLDRARLGEHGVCLASDGSTYGSAFVDAVARTTRRHVLSRSVIPTGEAIPERPLRQIRSGGCAALVFGGFGSDAGLIRIELDAAGLGGVRLIGADGMRDRTFLSVAETSGDGSVASCSCVDLGTSTSLSAQQFIHDYQSEFGGPPASYAVEGWDMGRLYVAAIRSGASTRSEVAAYLGKVRSFTGLAQTYGFSRSGGLLPSARLVQLFRESGGRWLPIGAPTGFATG